MNIKIESFGGRAFVLRDDLENDKEIIYFGPPRFDEADIVKSDEDMEKNIVGAITHETCHIVIYKVTQNLVTCSKMDNIDNPWTDNPWEGWNISGSFFAIGGKGR